MTQTDSKTSQAATTSAWAGQRVRLRGIEPDDWQAFMAMDADSDDVRNAWRLSPPQSAEGYRRWTSEQSAKEPDLDDFRLAIEPLSEPTVIGCVNTHDTDATNGTFMYGITIIRKYHRRGYASEAVVLLLRYMFGERRYQKCNVGVFSSNPGSIALHTRMGFIEEGRRRRSRYAAGRYDDEVLFGMTIEEFNDRYGL